MSLVLTQGRAFIDKKLVETDIRIDEGAIVELGSGLSAEEIIDLGGSTVIPGMIDCHSHVMLNEVQPLKRMMEPFSYQFFTATQTLRTNLDNGITTIRDAGGADAGVKKAVSDGLIEGPDMRISISALSQTGGHGDGWRPSGARTSLFAGHPGRPSGVVDGPMAVRQRVRELIRAGADVIKMHATGGVASPNDDPRHPHFFPDELEEAVRTADAAGITVMTHAQGAPGIMNALNAGVRSIDHGIFADDECFDLMIEKGAYLVPTLLAPVGIIRDIERGAQYLPSVVEKVYHVAGVHKEMVGRAFQRGVNIAFGTDAGAFPHADVLDELFLMVEAGMTPEAALDSATAKAADLIGADDRGRIETGKRADLIVVSGDPYDLHTHRERLQMVFKQGKKVRDYRPGH